jgi:hypothetical protein
MNTLLSLFALLCHVARQHVADKELDFRVEPSEDAFDRLEE